MLVCPISVLRHEAGNPYNFNIQFPIYTMGHVTLNLSMYHDTHIHWLDTNIIQFTWHLHDCLFPTQHTLQLDMQLTGEQSCHVSCHVIVRNHFSLSWSRGVAGCCCWSWLQEPGFEPATFRSLVNLLYPQPPPVSRHLGAQPPIQTKPNVCGLRACSSLPAALIVLVVSVK